MGRITPPFMPRSLLNVHGRKVGRGACLRSTKAVSRFRNAGMPVRFGPQAPRLAGAMVASRFCTPAIAVQVGGKAPAHPGNSFLKSLPPWIAAAGHGELGQRQSTSLPNWLRGFDTHIPLHSSRSPVERRREGVSSSLKSPLDHPASRMKGSATRPAVLMGR